jgi:hypothetical protein
VRRTLHLPYDSPTDVVAFDTLDEALAAIERFESRSPSGQGAARNSAPARFSTYRGRRLFLERRACLVYSRCS